MKLMMIVFALLTLLVVVAFLPIIKDVSGEVATSFGVETMPPFLQLMINSWPIIIFILLLITVVYFVRSRGT